jgi:predicted nucleic acid-binding protein
VGPQDVPAGPLAVDTDVFSFIHLRKGRHAEFAGLLAGHPLAMPFPVVGELKVGAIRGKVGERKRAVLEADIATCVVIPTDARVVDRWAALQARFLGRLKDGGINDLWIAACARSAAGNEQPQRLPDDRRRVPSIASRPPGPVRAAGARGSNRGSNLTESHVISPHENCATEPKHTRQKPLGEFEPSIAHLSKPRVCGAFVVSRGVTARGSRRTNRVSERGRKKAISGLEGVVRASLPHRQRFSDHPPRIVIVPDRSRARTRVSGPNDRTRSRAPRGNRTPPFNAQVLGYVASESSSTFEDGPMTAATTRSTPDARARAWASRRALGMSRPPMFWCHGARVRRSAPTIR